MIKIQLKNDNTNPENIASIGNTHPSHFEITALWTNAIWTAEGCSTHVQVTERAVNFVCSSEGADMLIAIGAALCQDFIYRKTETGVVIPYRFITMRSGDGRAFIN